MRRYLVVFVLLSLLFAEALYAAEIGGVVFEDSITVNGEKLILNGIGLRKKLLIKVYGAGLYLKEKTKDANVIIEKNEPMAIVLSFIHSEVPADKLIEAWNEGFEKSTGGNVGQFKKEIEQFNSVFKEAAKKGDKYELIYDPKSGTDVKINGAKKVSIHGHGFKKALFGIWLCNEPVDSKLKEGLLGN